MVASISWQSRLYPPTIFQPTSLLSEEQQEALAVAARAWGDEAKRWRDDHIAHGTLAADGHLPREKKHEISHLDGALRTSSVTEKDKSIGKKAITYLAQLTPGIPVISEEESEQDNAAALARAKATAAREGRPGPTYWVIDPIDGTDNYVDPQKREYGVLIGLIEDGQPRFGITYYPEFDQLNMTLGDKAIGRHAGEQNTYHLVPFAPLDNKGRTTKLSITPNVLRSLRTRILPEDAALSCMLEQHSIRTSCLAGSTRTMTGQSLDHQDYPNDQLVLEGKAQLSSITKGGFEWDCAGRHAILRAAGGEMRHKETGLPPEYGKDGPGYLRPVWLAHLETFRAIGLDGPPATQRNTYTGRG